MGAVMKVFFTLAFVAKVVVYSVAVGFVLALCVVLLI
jgi:hypothetical protein